VEHGSGNMDNTKTSDAVPGQVSWYLQRERGASGCRSVKAILESRLSHHDQGKSSDKLTSCIFKLTISEDEYM